jgi:hypothetical protein
MDGANMGTSGAVAKCYHLEGPQMLGFVAAILFIIGFIINAAAASTPAIFSPFSLLLAGLACLALHLVGVGTSWSLRR